MSCPIRAGETASDVVPALTGVARPSAPTATCGALAPERTYGSIAFFHGAPAAAWVNSRYSVPVTFLGLLR